MSESAEIEYPTCLRCGRGLRNPHSRRLGLGPVCAGKVRVAIAQRVSEAEDRLEAEGAERRRLNARQVIQFLTGAVIP